MAGLGEFYFLSKDELRAAFDAAKADKKDYLVVHTYSSDGEPFILRDSKGSALLGAGGRIVACDMIDIHEAATPVQSAQLVDDLVNIYASCGNLNVRAVYDLSRDFDQACGDETMLPAGVCDRAKAIVKKQEALRAWEQQPFFVRWFTSPKI